MKIGDKYIDSFSQIWKIFAIRNGVIILWNYKLGEGLWDRGRDLKLI